MARLPSGVYVIENVHNRNWAILTNDNDGDDVISGTDADTNTGHKWEVTKLSNGTYLLRNHHYRNHASYKLTDIGGLSSVVSIRSGDPKRWRINSIGDFFWISDLDGTRCWSLKYDEHETPIMLEKYTHSNHQHWKIVLENPSHIQVNTGEPPRSSARLQPGLKKCPPPTLVFTGRRDILLKMHRYFTCDLGKRHVYVLHGLGGVGKSQLSLKFIEECQVDANPSRFSDVVYVDATSAETAAADFRNIALAKGAGDSVEDALQWLSVHIEEWLLLINNADDPTLDLRKFFPSCSHGNIIITSRNSETRIHGPQSNSKVSGLTPDDAKDLLLKVSGVTEERDDGTISLATNIVKELGHLALAVVQAGAYISKSGCGLASYIEMYQERRTGFLEEYREQVQTIDDYEWTVYTTWTTSFDKLSPRAAMFLNICAFFHHDGISARIFQKAAANAETRRFITPRETNGLDIAKKFLSSFRSTEGHWDHRKFLAIISDIRSYSLIDFDERNEMYSIHPLVHSWTRSRASKTFHHCSQFILALSINITRISDDLVSNRFLLPHIDASLEVGTVTDSDIAAWLWYPYNESGRWKEADVLGSKALEISMRVHGERHRDTLKNMSNLAGTYSRMGRWKEAAKLDFRVLVVRMWAYGEAHPETLAGMRNLASTYSSMGRWDEAEVLQVQEIEMSKRVLGEDHPNTIASMAKLSSTYYRMGRLKEAEGLLVRVMEANKRDLGEEHPDTLTIMSNLAMTYYEKGRWKEAEELGVRVAEASKRILGENHPYTLTRIANLSLLTEQRNLWKRVKMFAKRVVAG